MPVMKETSWKRTAGFLAGGLVAMGLVAVLAARAGVRVAWLFTHRPEEVLAVMAGFVWVAESLLYVLWAWLFLRGQAEWMRKRGMDPSWAEARYQQMKSRCTVAGVLFVVALGYACYRVYGQALALQTDEVGAGGSSAVQAAESALWLVLGWRTGKRKSRKTKAC